MIKIAIVGTGGIAEWHASAFKNHRNAKSLNKYRILLKQLAVNNFILDCETPEAIEALIEKFPENQRPD